MKEVKTKTKEYINCPECNKGEHIVSHLYNQGDTNFGTWYCDLCGTGFQGLIKNNAVFIEITEKRKDNCLVFLKNNNILLVVDGTYFNNLDLPNQKYYYNEGTCPINYLRSTIEIYDLEYEYPIPDPHGIFQFLGVIKTKDINTNELENIIKPLLIKPELSKEVTELIKTRLGDKQ